MKTNTRSIFRAALLPLLGALAVTSAAAADLVVEVSGHKPAGGKVRVALYNDSNSFPRTPLRGVEGEGGQEPVVLTFKDVPPGTYALSVYQDENGNEKLDRGMFRVPKEPYGFSRDARGDKGPPEFRDAQIEVSDPSTKTAIKLR